jgi:hypothetical protein
VEEKNYQVPLMQEIYSTAENVFSWIGIEIGKTCTGSQAVEMMLSEFFKLTCYGYIYKIIRCGRLPYALGETVHLTNDTLGPGC